MVKHEFHTAGLLGWRIRHAATWIANLVRSAGHREAPAPFEPGNVRHDPVLPAAPPSVLGSNRELVEFERNRATAAGDYVSAPPNPYGVQGNGNPVPDWLIRKWAQDAAATKAAAVAPSAADAAPPPGDPVVLSQPEPHTSHIPPE